MTELHCNYHFSSSLFWAFATLNCGRFLKDIQHLNILLTLSGIQPVFDRRVNGVKFSKVGIFFCVIHICLCLYSDHILEQEARIARLFLPDVMYAMSIMQRICNLVYPLACSIGTIVQFKNLSKFLDSQDQFDLFLIKNSMNVNKLHKKIKKMELWSGVLSIFVAIISGVSYVEQAKVFSQPTFYTYYIGIFFSLNYTLILFKICNQFYAFHMRTELFTNHLKRILRRDIQQIQSYPVKTY